LTSLAKSREPWLLQRLLVFALNPSVPLREFVARDEPSLPFLFVAARTLTGHRLGVWSGQWQSCRPGSLLTVFAGLAFFIVRFLQRLAWQFIQTNWDDLYTRFGSGGNKNFGTLLFLLSPAFHPVAFTQGQL
jgi:hypothetical protein